MDYRVYDPEGDQQSKIDHMLEMTERNPWGMLDNALYHKELPFETVLMDSWYSSMQVMKHIESLGKVYYCPVKVNRQVDDSEGEKGYQRVDELQWDEEEQREGKMIHLKKMPKGHQVKLFRLVLSNERTDYVVTNDLTNGNPRGMTQDDSDVVKDHCGIRWKIEQFHRESKQVTGLEGCQCRMSRAWRNHIACSFLVWAHLKRFATQFNTNVYQFKSSLLTEGNPRGTTIT
jgi:hypothetical protein